MVLPFAPLWGALALGLGLLIAYLPWPYSVGLVVGVALVGLAVWEPVIGLGLTVVLGPLKAYLEIAPLGIPADLGQLFFALAVAGWLARGLLTRRVIIPFSPLFWWLIPYLFIGALSLLNATALDEGLKELLKWAQIAGGLLIATAEIQRGRLPWLLAALACAGFMQAAIGYWQYDLRGTGPSHFQILGDHYRAYGSFEQPNPYGGFLGLLWPLFAGLGLEALRPHLPKLLRLDLRPYRSLFTAHCLLFTVYFLLLFALAAFCLLGLYLSFSRGAWLGAAAAGLALALAYPKRGWLGVGLVVLGLLGGFFLAQAGLLPASLTSRLAALNDFTTFTDARGFNLTPENFALVERLAHWQAALEMARAHPWLGVGLGNYSAAYPTYHLLNWPNALGHAHMIFLNVLAETGLLGLGAYLLLWGGVIAFTMHACRRTHGLPRGLALGLLGAWAHLTAHQLVDNLYVNNLHFTIAVLLGLLWYCLSVKSNSRLSSAEPVAHQTP